MPPFLVESEYFVSLIHVTETKSHPYIISYGDEYKVVFIDTFFLSNLREVHMVPLQGAITEYFPALPDVRSNKCLHVTYPVRIGDCLCP